MRSATMPVRASWFSKYVPLAGSGCRLFYPMQDDPQKDECKDISGYGNNGSISGATWERLGSGLWVLALDGSNDYVACGTDSSIVAITDQITIAFWIYRQNPSLYSTPMRTANTVGGAGYYTLDIGAGRIGLGVSYGGSNYDSYPAVNAITDEVWTYWVGTYDRTKVRTYINAVKSSDEHAYTGDIPSSDRQLTMGCHPLLANYFHGKLGLPMILGGVAWTQSQISFAFNQQRSLFKV